MPVQSGDVKLLSPAVMADVPEGGGVRPGLVIADGVSDAIFPDISGWIARRPGQLRKELRASGPRMTPTPASGPTSSWLSRRRTSASASRCFSTRKTFDTREQAQTRIEGLPQQRAGWAGYLFREPHCGSAGDPALPAPP